MRDESTATTPPHGSTSGGLLNAPVRIRLEDAVELDGHLHRHRFDIAKRCTICRRSKIDVLAHVRPRLLGHGPDDFRIEDAIDQDVYERHFDDYGVLE